MKSTLLLSLSCILLFTCGFAKADQPKSISFLGFHEKSVSIQDMTKLVNKHDPNLAVLKFENQDNTQGQNQEKDEIQSFIMTITPMGPDGKTQTFSISNNIFGEDVWKSISEHSPSNYAIMFGDIKTKKGNSIPDFTIQMIN